LVVGEFLYQASIKELAQRQFDILRVQARYQTEVFGVEQTVAFNSNKDLTVARAWRSYRVARVALCAGAIHTF
jgi:hypothetical protein